MPDQETRPKQTAAARPAHSLFFAAVPPAEISDSIARAWQMFGTEAPYRHDKLHLSIHAVAATDHLDPVLVARSKHAAQSLRTAPFTLRFDRLMAFNGHALVLATEKTSPELNALAAELHAACRARDITTSRAAKVTPHVTLAYGPGFPETRLLDQPVVWHIDEIQLIDSRSPQRAHEALGAWPLPKDLQQQGFDF